MNNARDNVKAAGQGKPRPAGALPPLPALVAMLEEILAATDALIQAYNLRLSLNPGLRRGERRTHSTLRALCKARNKTEASIEKARRRMASGGSG